MTDAEIDALDSLALRRAVAAAVGWTISPISFGSDDRFASSGGYRYLRSWDDAIAACESAGMNFAEIIVAVKRFNNPVDLCRALLKAIAAQNNAKLTAIERAAT